MKFRLLVDENEKELTVLTEDGGIACIREADDISPNEPRIATTDYYHIRITELESATPENLFDLLGEGMMSCNDWADDQYNSLILIQDALSWLSPTEVEWNLCDSIFSEFFPNTNVKV